MSRRPPARSQLACGRCSKRGVDGGASERRGSQLACGRCSKPPGQDHGSRVRPVTTRVRALLETGVLGDLAPAVDGHNSRAGAARNVAGYCINGLLEESQLACGRCSKQVGERLVVLQNDVTTRVRALLETPCRISRCRRLRSQLACGRCSKRNPHQGPPRRRRVTTRVRALLETRVSRRRWRSWAGHNSRAGAARNKSANASSCCKTTSQLACGRCSKRPGPVGRRRPAGVTTRVRALLETPHRLRRESALRVTTRVRALLETRRPLAGVYRPRRSQLACGRCSKPRRERERADGGLSQLACGRCSKQYVVVHPRAARGGSQLACGHCSPRLLNELTR